MQSCRTVLFSERNKLAIVNIRRGIFQGDSLSPLLFVVALILLTIILRTLKQGYSFRKEKEKLNHLLFMDDLKLCDSNETKRGIQVHYEGIDLGDGVMIEEADGKGYKYLGILEGG